MASAGSPVPVTLRRLNEARGLDSSTRTAFAAAMQEEEDRSREPDPCLWFVRMIIGGMLAALLVLKVHKLP